MTEFILFCLTCLLGFAYLKFQRLEFDNENAELEEHLDFLEECLNYCDSNKDACSGTKKRMKMRTLDLEKKNP